MRLVKDSEILKINGTAIPSATKTTVSWEDVHGPNSGRTLDAQMHIDVVARKRKVEVHYDVLSQEDMGRIQGLLQGTYYQFTYFDPLYRVHTIRSYASSTSQELYNALLLGGFWRNVEFHVIEV